MERGKYPIDLDFKPLSGCNMMSYIEKKKVIQDFDLNAPADSGFDLNKFPEEGEEAFEEKEFQQVVRIMLKVYLPKYY